MHKTELTPAEKRAYRRLASAAREVERIEECRKRRTTSNAERQRKASRHE